MYACLHVCMVIGVRVDVCLYVGLCMWAYAHMCTYPRVHGSRCACVLACVHVCRRVGASVHVLMLTSVQVMDVRLEEC